MRMHEFVSRSLKRRLTGKQRGEYEKQKHLIREHGGPSLRSRDMGHVEAALARHGVTSIPTVDREIGFRGPASIKREKKQPLAQVGGRGRGSFQRVGFGVHSRSSDPTHDAQRKDHTKVVTETVLNPARRRAHQTRGGPKARYRHIKMNAPEARAKYREGADRALHGRRKLHRGLGPAAEGPQTGPYGYRHPRLIHSSGAGPEGYPSNMNDEDAPKTGGVTHVRHEGPGHVAVLSHKDRATAGSKAATGSVPATKYVGIGYKSAESSRAEQQAHGERAHAKATAQYEKDLKRYEDHKATQSGKRGSGRGPGTGKPSTATRRIWSTQYKKWIDAPVSRIEENPHLRQRKEWWEDDYSSPLLGSTLGGGASVVGGFGSPKKPVKPKPINEARVVGSEPERGPPPGLKTKKELHDKYQKMKKRGETIFHKADGTKQSLWQPSDEELRYAMAVERGLASNIHEYGVLKDKGKAPRFYHEGGPHPADFNEFGDYHFGRKAGEGSWGKGYYPSSGYYSGAEGLSEEEADKHWETENIQPQYVTGAGGEKFPLTQSIHTRSRGGRPPHGEGYTRMMGGPVKKSARYSKFLNVRRGSGEKEGAIGVTVKGKGRPGRQGGKPKRIKVGGQRPANPAAIAQRKEEEENSFPYRSSLQEFATAIRNPRTNMAVAKQIMGGAHEDPRKLAALKREAANRNIGKGKFIGPLEHPEQSRLRAAQKAYTTMARKGRMGRLLGEHTRPHNIKRSPLVDTGQGRRDWDLSDENLQEFYGPAINLRDFRPGHLEFRGRKTGGRGKKMMMPGHYKFSYIGPKKQLSAPNIKIKDPDFWKWHNEGRAERHGNEILHNGRRNPNERGGPRSVKEEFGEKKPPDWERHMPRPDKNPKGHPFRRPGSEEKYWRKQASKGWDLPDGHRNWRRHNT